MQVALVLPCLTFVHAFVFGLAVGEDDPLERFLEASSRSAAEALVADVLATEHDFETLLARLRAGRDYAADVPRGKHFQTRTIAGREHHVMLQVPVDYDPKRSYGIRFDLHGGMGQPEWKEADGSWSPGYAAIDEYHASILTVLPAGWWDSMWWEASQVDHFRAILDDVKRTYNIDENHVVFVGGSDGAVALWFYAMREPTPWLGYAGWVGFPARLTSRELRADGQLHLSNLNGQRFFLVNGVKDRIIAIDVVREYLELFRTRTDAEIDAREHAKDGHSFKLTEDEESTFVELLFRSRRDPFPDRLDWATERTDRYNRRAWLEITGLDPAAPIDTENILPRIYGRNVPRTKPPEPVPFGRVRLERLDNLVRARTSGGVRSFRLLLAPDEFDFDQDITVEVDGEIRFQGRVARDREVLLRRFAQDCDRTALIAAELEVELPPAAGASERPRSGGR